MQPTQNVSAIERPPYTLQNSSLGISKALKPDIAESGQGNLAKSSLKDDTFREVSEKDNIFTWVRFYISLYYNKMAVGMFGYFTGWKWYNRIDDRVILGALPAPAHIKQLHAQDNVSIVVNMCAEFPGYKRLYDDLGVTQVRLATSDFTIPTLDTISSGMNQLLELMNQSKEASVYLHCKAGRGRSAVFALCYLIQRYKLNPAEAQKVLQQHRPQIDRDLFQTDEVRMFYKEINAMAESGKIVRAPYPYISSV